MNDASTRDLKGKHKRFLRAMGSGIDPIIQIGKGALAPNVIKQIDDALEARELIKIRVLNNCAEEIDRIAERVASATDAHLIQLIGHVILLYRPSKTKPQIELPN
ncbi:hypothetical protein Tfer_1783 [Thermincola ferriacetica]|uniref:CRM domain-containing protein n=1 Tax=Thermincola ferriacetica TaxID=281456 RepID=A0A0L6W2D5_9FIRM|nr:ribosome assembly RNA-binding protein YhbY [Thermincola ferriacetica]KNZ69538.1 hypothetical protein Tfer_1783 [Thermincola ferriacetica]